LSDTIGRSISALFGNGRNLSKKSDSVVLVNSFILSELLTFGQLTFELPIQFLRRNMTRTLLLSLLFFATIFSVIRPTLAQQQQPEIAPAQNPQVAMIMLRIEHNKGRDYIITPKGFRAQVPGKGIASNAKAVAVYQDQQQNYWYIDKHGEPTPVKPQVVQSCMAQFQAQIQKNQAAQNFAGGTVQMGNGGAPVQQTTIVQQPSSGGGSGAGAAMGVASMAMSGAAMGMSIGALSNSGHNYYGVPYGHPIYQDNHHYYYNNNSKKVFVNQNVSNKAAFDQFNKMGSWNNRSAWSKNLTTQRYDHGYGRRFRR
jgi:hypothetical protein